MPRARGRVLVDREHDREAVPALASRSAQSCGAGRPPREIVRVFASWARPRALDIPFTHWPSQSARTLQGRRHTPATGSHSRSTCGLLDRGPGARGTAVPGIRIVVVTLTYTGREVVATTTSWVARLALKRRSVSPPLGPQASASRDHRRPRSDDGGDGSPGSAAVRTFAEIAPSANITPEDERSASSSRRTLERGHGRILYVDGGSTILGVPRPERT